MGVNGVPLTSGAASGGLSSLLSGFGTGGATGASVLGGAAALAVPMIMGLSGPNGTELNRRKKQEILDKVMQGDAGQGTVGLYNRRKPEQYSRDVQANMAPQLPSDIEKQGWSNGYHGGDALEGYRQWAQNNQGRMDAADAAFKKLHPDHWDANGNIIPARIAGMPDYYYGRA